MNGPNVPGFARNYPDHPQLAKLLTALERGQHDVVQSGCNQLVSSDPSPEVVAAARDLQRRLRPDPMVAKILIGTLALLVFLAAWAYWSGR